MDDVIKVLLIILLVIAIIALAPLIFLGITLLVGLLKGCAGSVLLWVIIIALIIYIIWGSS